MKSKEEIEKMANEFSKDYIKTTNNSILQSSFKLEVGYIKGYKQCQEDMVDKIKEAVNLLDKIVENTELFFGYDVANKNSNIRNAKIFIKSLNKQD